MPKAGQLKSNLQDIPEKRRRRPARKRAAPGAGLAPRNPCLPIRGRRRLPANNVGTTPENNPTGAVPPCRWRGRGGAASPSSSARVTRRQIRARGTSQAPKKPRAAGPAGLWGNGQRCLAGERGPVRGNARLGGCLGYYARVNKNEPVSYVGSSKAPGRFMVDGYQPLTDSQWQVMEPLLPVHGNRRLCLRRVLDAVRYVCRTGCQWRALPATFPAWTAV